jgi:hypothetical protein
MTLVGAYLLWRVARRLIPLVLLAGVALVLLAPHQRLRADASHVRHAVQVDLAHARQALTRALETHLQR